MESQTRAEGYSGRRWTAALALAVLVGWTIAWIDSRPGWDDAGITAGLILLAAAGFTLFDPGRAWLWPLAVGVWIPLVGILSTGNYGSLLALAIAFVGGGAAWLAVRGLRAIAGPPRV